MEENKHKGDTIKIKTPNFFKKAIFWQISTILLLILLIASLFSVLGGGIGKENAKNKVQDYINLVLADQASLISLGDVSEERGMYKIEMIIQDQIVTGYVSKDGKLFFPTSVELDNPPTLPQLRENIQPEDLEIDEANDEDLVLEEDN